MPRGTTVHAITLSVAGNGSIHLISAGFCGSKRAVARKRRSFFEWSLEEDSLPSTGVMVHVFLALAPRPMTNPAPDAGARATRQPWIGRILDQAISFVEAEQPRCPIA
ncbi:MAG: hypothetical protein P4M07_18205 [Xanthobacteraceae bacterium]|nr:hypothetical protein [Xanthobacteraceae bacterium]